MSSSFEIDFHPATDKLRRFGFIAAAAFGLLAAAAHNGLGPFRGVIPHASGIITAVLLAAGVLSGAFSLVAPRANRAMFVGLSVLSYPVNWVVSRAVLALVFFGLFAPIGVIMKVTGRDVLRRRAHGAATDTYWVRARGSRRLSDYFRQF